MQRPTSTSKMTHGITEDLNGRLAAGQLKDNRSTETPIRACENRSVSQVSSGPIPTPDARTRSEPIDWVTHHATAVLPLPGFVAVDTMTSVQRTRDPAFIPDDPLTYEWTQRLVSLIAPNTYTEALHERALLTVGSVAQGSLGAHTFAIGAHTEKTYLWESDLDIGIFLAGFDPPEASDDTERVHTATPAAQSPAAPLETAPGTRTRLAGVVDDPDRPPAPNDAWPVRIASALCEAAARLAYRQPQIVAAPNDPLNATRMTASSCCASDAADAMAGMPRFAASASACPRAGRGMTLQPPIRRRSRRRRRHRREDTAASAVSLPAEVACLSLSEQGVACRLASDGDASVVCVPEPDHLVCADVTVPGSSHSSSGEEQSPERRLSGLVRDRSEARQADTDADLVPGLESIDSLTIERAVNAGMSGLGHSLCKSMGCPVRLMLNPATALCRSLFLAECDEIIGHKHIFIRCLLLLKAWWRYSPATSQVRQRSRAQYNLCHRPCSLPCC
ncbi:hypothetical protein F1559_000536 [Cyanidiococcus yangmingshanensis]|uniref:Uncharacterized protein n=1 Tax=Cyanidiococcus yangmingshanensis TaxID=2690220 RepID=A0A7J7II02_9RHOD|nr:hypothetical protein F1559_000536 [Cyanidiococcus yangmingshanensis]